MCIVLSICIFNVILDYLLSYHMDNNSEKYNQLLFLASNDLSRNLLFIFGIFYSCIASFLLLVTKKVSNKLRKKLNKSC